MAEGGVNVDHKDLKQNNQENIVINRNRSVKSGRATDRWEDDFYLRLAAFEVPVGTYVECPEDC